MEILLLIRYGAARSRRPDARSLARGAVGCKDSQPPPPAERSKTAAEVGGVTEEVELLENFAGLLAIVRVGDRGLLVELLLELGRGLLELGHLLAQIGGCLGVDLVFLDQLGGVIEFGRELGGLGLQVLGAGARVSLIDLLNRQSECRASSRALAALS